MNNTNEKNGYEHFMLKEIYEQPETIRKTLDVDLSDMNIDQIFTDVERIYMIGCGTAYHAGLIGRLAIEKLAKIPVDSEIASEFRYRDVLWAPNSLIIVVSQSGETADTLDALRKAKQNGVKSLAITNVADSTIAKEADKVIYTQAGPEIAIASTKAFTSQIITMYQLAIHLASVKGTLPKEELESLNNDLMQVDKIVEKVLTQQEKIKKIAEKYKDVQNAFFLGRSFDHVIAMEGQLKLKETSYVHAEAYPTGELKHGPFALLEEGILVVTLNTQDHLAEKTLSNMKEVKERGANVMAICKEQLEESCKQFDDVITLPELNSVLTPLLSVIPLQLFSYYMALFRDCDVDKPRNLQKAVTE
ncbi:Glutamine--fructose-6-phosphate aminotransferase [isomerizing] [Candidatus Syntrophocurvum alkaliphilum]|uniref:Glutamine--fructose-6-phosphate aminotransferase [isomerizing] n=1 Tax=Candidatus Syntrophocurvum alkaliphilum TaxID=2293317 RepID=A0A6I6DJC6_9FIRM|nr:glutamine--fructose-6-phosphate transaminase (isomerizing) [Candidatus Syntrophocurvum alkaliphilum]QGU00884.1 Glutamine--fructose-6-phosphate aminotransferase [isomerizing] [Candidatus Syntrophocurvum alkaliphilum]